MTETQQNRVLWSAGLAYALLYLMFFPRMYTTMDESAYLGLAYTLLHGTVYVDMAGISTVFMFPVGSHEVVMYPPGMSALLTLAGIVGWKTVMGVNLITHLATYAVVIAILRRLKLPALFSLLYLLHPTAVIFSRTVMTDIPTGFLIASAFLLYLKRRYVGAGAVLGVALLLRNASVVSGPLLIAGCLLDSTLYKDDDSSMAAPRTLNLSDLRQRIWAAIQIGLGFAPLFALAYYYQAVIQQGGWHKFPLLKLSSLPHGIKTYGLFLIVLYPLMLVAPLLYRRAGKGALNCLIFGFILLYSCYDFTDTAPNKYEAFIVGQRYLLTMMPLLVISYAGALTEFAAGVPKATRTAVAGLTLACLAVASIGVSYLHQGFLKKNEAIQQSLLLTIQPADTLLCSSQIGKFFSPGWGGKRVCYPPTVEAVSVVSDAVRQGRRVVLAEWIRDYRGDAVGEQKWSQFWEKDYTLRPFTEDERHGLPDEVRVYQLEAKPAP